MMMKIVIKLAASSLLLLAVACGTGTETVSWSPADIPIRTEWAAEVSPASAHPEYPRPQMVRAKWASLNGLWNYAVTAADAPQPAQWDGKILVPFCIESSLSGVGRRVSAEEALWYGTTFQVPSAWKKDRVMLNFEAVDWAAEVYVNDRLAGRHTGGYTAFSFDITDLLQGRGAQKLVLKVLDGTNNGEQPCGKQVKDPSGIWYTPVTGIWQSVWMEPVRKAGAVTSYLAVPDVDAGAVDVTVHADGGSAVEVVEALREAGAEVLGIVSIFTYGMARGLERLAAAGVVNHSLSDLDALVEVAAAEGYIAPEWKERILRFRDNPSDTNWKL